MPPVSACRCAGSEVPPARGHGEEDGEVSQTGALFSWDPNWDSAPRGEMQEEVLPGQLARGGPPARSRGQGWGPADTSLRSPGKSECNAYLSFGALPLFSEAPHPHSQVTGPPPQCHVWAPKG